MENNTIKIIQTEILEAKPHRLKKITYEMQKEDGSWEKRFKQVCDNGQAATILLYNTEKKTVLLTSQFRLPSYLNGNHAGMLLETCAGMLEEDSPEACAIREAEEETGYKITEVQKLFEVYMSPGFVTEIVHFFKAAYNDSMKVSEGGGLKEENENIEVKELTLDEAIGMINNGQIKDAKTIILLQYAKLNQIV